MQVDRATCGVTGVAGETDYLAHSDTHTIIDARLDHGEVRVVVRVAIVASQEDRSAAQTLVDPVGTCDHTADYCYERSASRAHYVVAGVSVVSADISGGAEVVVIVVRPLDREGPIGTDHHYVAPQHDVICHETARSGRQSPDVPLDGSGDLGLGVVDFLPVAANHPE